MCCSGALRIDSVWKEARVIVEGWHAARSMRKRLLSGLAASVASLLDHSVSSDIHKTWCAITKDVLTCLDPQNVLFRHKVYLVQCKMPRIKASLPTQKLIVEAVHCMGFWGQYRQTHNHIHDELHLWGPRRHLRLDSAKVNPTHSEWCLWETFNHMITRCQIRVTQGPMVSDVGAVSPCTARPWPWPRFRWRTEFFVVKIKSTRISSVNFDKVWECA